MLGSYNANLIDARGAVIVIPVALFFGGLMQIIVAVLEVFRGNVFGAVVFGTYGPFWVIYGVLLTLYITSIPLAAVRSALALFLAMFAILSFFFFVASLRKIRTSFRFAPSAIARTMSASVMTPTGRQTSSPSTTTRAVAPLRLIR